MSSSVPLRRDIVNREISNGEILNRDSLNGDSLTADRLTEELTGQRVRVLIAEDDAGVRCVLSELILADPGLELVGVVTDTAGVIALAAEERPDVAIVDVRMPGGGGVFAARGIREVSSETKVIAFSGETDPAVTTEMFAAGAIGYLVKGSSITTILGSIRAAAGGSSSN